MKTKILVLLYAVFGLLALPHLHAQCPTADVDTIMFETFETGLPADWAAAPGSDGGQWQVNAETIGYYPNPGQGAWLYVNDEAGNGIGRASVVTPTLDLREVQGDVSLSMDLLFQEFADSGYMALELWDGSTWTTLRQDSLDFAGKLTLDISAYAGRELALRLTYDDEGSWGWGMGLDNVLLTGRTSTCGDGICDPGETPGLCPEDCPYLSGPAPAWIPVGEDLRGQPVSYRHFKGGTRCDDCSEEIQLPFDLTLFGESYRTVWLNANGSLSCAEPYKTYTPEPFCLEGPKLIAPFFADADLNAGGEIRYYLDPEGHYVIATWVEVGYYGCTADCELSNTFQVIVTDGTVRQVGDLLISPGTDIIFNYGDMQWTTGNSSGGAEGLGGSAATVGLNAGDGATCEGYGRFNQTGYAFLPDAAHYTCPSGGVSHLDYQTLLFQGDIGMPMSPGEPETDTGSDLFSLSGAAHPEGNVLQWNQTTSDEVVSFIIDRGIDGQSYQQLYEWLDPVIGQGGQLRYTDEVPLEGINHYRVRQLDQDGNLLGEAVVQIDRSQRPEKRDDLAISQLQLAPNPFREQANISFELTIQAEITYSLTDLSGRQVRRGRLIGESGYNQFQLHSQDLPMGTYLLTVRTRDVQQTIRVIRQ